MDHFPVAATEAQFVKDLNGWHTPGVLLVVWTFHRSLLAFGSKITGLFKKRHRKDTIYV